MKWKKPSQQTVAATHSDLPDECWECIFRFLVKNDLNSVSLVSKRFLSISDRLRFSITVVNTEKNVALPIIVSLLERFTNLKSLKLLNKDYDFNNLLCNISHFPFNKLTSLKISNLGSCCDLTESAFFSLVRNCPSLSKIIMENTAVSSNILRDFVGLCPQLKSLYLARCEHLKDENIILFSSIFPNLELLDLSRCDKISEGLICQFLRRCCKIRHLNLARCSRVNLHGINFVVPKLEVLDLSYTKVDDETLYVISKNCPGLLELLLENCENITPEGVKHVEENCTQLRKVYLGGFHIINEIRELFSRQGCLLFKYFSADF